MLPLGFLWKIKGKSINPGWSISSFFKIPFFFLLFFFSPIHVFQRVIIKFKDCNSDRIHYILKIKGSKENKKNSNRLNTLPVQFLFTKITESLVQTNPNHLLPTFFTTFYKIDIFKNPPSIPVDVNDRKRAKGGLFWKKKKNTAANLESEAERGRRVGSETVVSRSDKDKCPDPSSSSSPSDCAPPPPSRSSCCKIKTGGRWPVTITRRYTHIYIYTHI